MTAILGISAFYHDSAAALAVDGRVVAASQEERFTRKKHDPAFPSKAVAACLAQGGLRVEDLDWVGFYDKPLQKFERLLETYLAHAPVGFRSFAKALPLWVREKLFLPRAMHRELGEGFRKRFVFAEHHESHAASAFYPSPFDEAAILTLDGVGEWATASFGTGRGCRLDLTHQLRFPHSLGLLYSAFTTYCGFRVNSGEYKLMGLAPYGEPRYADIILRDLIDLKADGSFRMDQAFFRYAQGLTMTSARFHRLFGGPPRKPESPLTSREMDLAASIQEVAEEVVLRMARHVHEITGLPDLCLAGGVALNCVANGRLLAEGPFERIWVQPAAGDAGGALGVALLIHHRLLGHGRIPEQPDAMQGALLGPSYSQGAIEAFLRSVEAPFEPFDDDEALCEAVAAELAEGAVVGWFQGRMEFGPRSLGSRSLLGDPRDPAMQSTMNLKIKFRESFRPFAPSVLADRADDYFAMPRGGDSPYMLVVAPVRPEHRVEPQAGDRDLFGIDRLKVPRSTIPAVTHVDGSARVQTVDDARNPLFARLLRAFEARTGCPLLINTSFNVRGEPIVESPADAYRGFLATGIDVLALGRCVVRKGQQKPMAPAEVEAFVAQFPLD